MFVFFVLSLGLLSSSSCVPLPFFIFFLPFNFLLALSLDSFYTAESEVACLSDLRYDLFALVIRRPK